MTQNNQKSEEQDNQKQAQPADDLQAKIKQAQQDDQAKNDDDNMQDEKGQKIQELTEALQRSMADMQNMKRRSEEDKIRFAKFANAEFLKSLIPIIDNFDRACQQIPEDIKENGWTKGVTKTHEELMKALETIGVKKIKTIGEKLDPNKHEALMQGAGEKDVIIEEFEPGYLYHDQTLKAAKVKVGNGE